jgi:hypothetical protein
MRVSRITVFALVAALLGSVALGGIASGADTIKVRTKVTIKFHNSDYNDSFSGRVKARGRHPAKIKRKCRSKRKVTVFRVQGTGKTRIGSTKSKRTGRWTVRVGGDADPGRYFARAKKKTFRRHGDKVVCKRGKSRRITVA